MIKDFEKPPKEYYPVPWWAWTGNMRKDEMYRQLIDMKDKGIYEFFIFAIYGLEYPIFLKKSWWEMVEFTLKTCRKLGMKVWIYDDLNWPSGSAGGWLLRDHPECRAWILDCQITKIRSGESYKCDSSKIPVFNEFRGDNGQRHPVELSDGQIWTNTTGTNGDLIFIERVPFEKVLLNCIGTVWAWGQRGYCDLLSRSAVQEWMNYIHKEYWRKFSTYFDSTLKGFFFDEPYAHPSNGHSAPWTPKLFEDFKKRYGYNLCAHLGKLFFDDPGFMRVRYDYWRLIAEYFGLNFSKQISDWCKEKKVLSTGHCVNEEQQSQQRQVACNGDIYQILKWMQVPGIDLLRRQTSFRKWTDGQDISGLQSLILTAKRASSTARYSGARRVMCEAFGVRSWNATMAEQKIINDWLAAMGINLINDNSLVYTISDFRKRAISGKHFTQPWWKYYRAYSEYCARISLFASTGYIDTEVAVLFPTATNIIMTPMDNRKDIPKEGKLVEVMNAVSESLVREHIDFEFLFEEIVSGAVIKNGKLKVPHAEFKVVILPKMHVMDEKVYEKLSEFADSGGIVISVDSGPEWIISPNSRNGNAQHFKDKGRFRFIGYKNKEDRAAFSKRLIDTIVRLWRLEGKGHRDIVTCMRKDGDKRMLLVANQTQEEKHLTFHHSFREITEIMDVETGRIFTAPVRRKSRDTVFDFCLGEEQSYIILLHAKKSERARPVNGLNTWIQGYKEIAVLDKTWDFSVEPMNHFLPRLWIRLDPRGKGRKEKWFQEKNSPSENREWMPVTDEKYSMAFSQEESPYYWLWGTYSLKTIKEDLCLIVDNDSYRTVYINGKVLNKSSPYSLWDQSNRKFSIAKLSHVGENYFTIRVSTSPWYSQSRGMIFDTHFTDPVVIGGMFQVIDIGKKKILGKVQSNIRSGSWTNQGYPNFAGTGIYRQKVKITSLPKIVKLVVEDAFTVVEAEVNGQKVGIRPWRPYVFNISKALQKGDNEIVLKVTNGLGNILRRYYCGKLGEKSMSGILGKVSLIQGN